MSKFKDLELSASKMASLEEARNHILNVGEIKIRNIFLQLSDECRNTIVGQIDYLLDGEEIELEYKKIKAKRDKKND